MKMALSTNPRPVVVTPFAFGEHLVRTAGTPEAPLFCGKDVCAALGIKNSRDTLHKFPDDEKGVATTDTLGGHQELTFLTEAGLYRLIFLSRKPEAERFRKWVFGEVLPSLRRTGRYGVAPVLPRDAELEGMVAAVLQLRDGGVPLEEATVAVGRLLVDRKTARGLLARPSWAEEQLLRVLGQLVANRGGDMHRVQFLALAAAARRGTSVEATPELMEGLEGRQAATPGGRVFNVRVEGPLEARYLALRRLE